MAANVIQFTGPGFLGLDTIISGNNRPSFAGEWPPGCNYKIHCCKGFDFSNSDIPLINEMELCRHLVGSLDLFHSRITDDYKQHG